MQGPGFGMIRIIENSSTDSVARVSRARPRGNLDVPLHLPTLPILHLPPRLDLGTRPILAILVA